MTIKTLGAAATLATMLTAATAHAGQVQPAASPTPTPSATPARPLSGLDDFTLPVDPPTPAASDPATGQATVPAPAPSPTVTPVPRPTPRPSATPRSGATPRSDTIATLDARPRVRPTPEPSPVTEPVPTASPSTAPQPSPSPIPTVTAATPSRVAPTEPVPADTSQSVATNRWPLVVAALVVLALLGWLLARRRRRPEAVDEPATMPEAVATLPPPPPAPLRPRLAIDLVPARGGLTLISMVFEGELLVRNEGDAPATEVLVEATLLPARSEQDAELGALFARPIGRPATPAFTLASGEERRVRIVAAMPLAGVEPLMAGGRPMLVPVLAANVVHAGSEAPGQAAASWIVGVAREGSAKLAPFWVDAPRMSDRLGARPHALAVSR